MEHPLVLHHNKALPSPATRAFARLAVPLALILVLFCAAGGLRGSVIQRQSSSPVQPASTARQLAEKDAQVGRFYLKIGKYDASISRFQSAVQHDPAWAEPHELLGEAFEKKNDPKHALAEYREYLKIDPHAKDAKNIEKRMEKLTRELQD